MAPWKETLYILSLYEKSDDGKEADPIVYETHQDPDD